MSSSSSSSSSSASAAAREPNEIGIADVCVLVDYRERDLLRNCFPFLERPFPYSVVNCATADLIVCVVSDRAPRAEETQCAATPAVSAQGEVCAALRGQVGVDLPRPFTPSTRTYTPVFAVERKAVPDLTNSIRGRGSSGSAVNRFKDQKLRLLAFCAETGAKPYLLVEGLRGYAREKAVEGMPFEAVHTALTNTCARDGITVQHEGNVHESARWVNKLCKCIVKHQLRTAKQIVGPNGQREMGAVVATKNSLQEHAQAVSVRKADNLTPQLGFRTWLMTARGMSSEKAGAIMERHKTIAGLVNAYTQHRRRASARMTEKKAERECELMLQNIEITTGGRTANGHYRKIGPALSKAVYVRLFQEQTEDQLRAAQGKEKSGREGPAGETENPRKRKCPEQEPSLSPQASSSSSRSARTQVFAQSGKKKKSSAERGADVEMLFLARNLE